MKNNQPVVNLPNGWGYVAGWLLCPKCKEELEQELGLGLMAAYDDDDEEFAAERERLSKYEEMEQLAWGMEMRQEREEIIGDYRGEWWRYSSEYDDSGEYDYSDEHDDDSEYD